jgi:hypothetical protein
MSLELSNSRTLRTLELSNSLTNTGTNSYADTHTHTHTLCLSSYSPCKIPLSLSLFLAFTHSLTLSLPSRSAFTPLSFSLLVLRTTKQPTDWRVDHETGDRDARTGNSPHSLEHAVQCRGPAGVDQRRGSNVLPAEFWAKRPPREPEKHHCHYAHSPSLSLPLPLTLVCVCVCVCVWRGGEHKVEQRQNTGGLYKLMGRFAEVSADVVVEQLSDHSGGAVATNSKGKVRAV